VGGLVGVWLGSGGGLVGVCVWQEPGIRRSVFELVRLTAIFSVL
jgi:hypothetical protein